MEFNCFFDKNDLPRGYLTEIVKTVFYIILFLVLVQLYLDMLSTIFITFSSTLDAWMELLPHGAL